MKSWIEAEALYEKDIEVLITVQVFTISSKSAQKSFLQSPLRRKVSIATIYQ